MATSMDLIKPLVTLVAIVNPLGIVPFFIHYTQGYTHGQRMRTLLVIVRRPDSVPQPVR